MAVRENETTSKDQTVESMIGTGAQLEQERYKSGIIVGKNMGVSLFHTHLWGEETACVRKDSHGAFGSFDVGWGGGVLSFTDFEIGGGDLLEHEDKGCNRQNS